MRFTYTYRSSDGRRHAAEIEAPNREAAFEKIWRELGVKPIKVTVAEAAATVPVNGSGAKSPSVARKALLATECLTLLTAGLCGTWWWFTARRNDAPYRVMTQQGPVTYTVATPLARQMIPGDRARIEVARETAFRSDAERLLAQYAEPGRMVVDAIDQPSNEDFEACLKEPIRIASTDFTEVVDLKRIVAGMKREMRAYLTGGGTVEQYIIELSKRQRLEVSYRERAEQKLADLFEKPKEAYAYWLKANASLKSMGIHELPLPDALRFYQMNLDLDD